MLTFRNKYRFNRHSQNGEDGIIEEIINRLELPIGYAVEFGAPTKKWMSNIYHLSELGWECEWLDNDPKEGGIKKVTITPENVNTIFQVPDILSIDIDGNDFEIWKAYEGRPDVVIVEINSSLDPLADSFTPETGCNFSAMVHLGKMKGYFLCCHTGNLIFIANEYRQAFTDIEDVTRENTYSHFDKSWLK